MKTLKTASYIKKAQIPLLDNISWLLKGQRLNDFQMQTILEGVVEAADDPFNQDPVILAPIMELENLNPADYPDPIMQMIFVKLRELKQKVSQQPQGVV